MTGRFADSLLDEIRARLPVSEVVQKHGVKLRRRGREWVGLSPFHPERTPSFTVNDTKGFFHCFSANKHGDIFAFEQEMTGATFPAVVLELARVAGVVLPSSRGSPQTPPAEDPDRAAAREAAWAAKKAKAEAEIAAERALQIAKAQWLWSRRQPITEECAAGLYLRRRGYQGIIPATLGFVPSHGEHPPAMIAAFGLAPEIEPGIIAAPATVTAVHLTRLTPDGHKAELDPDESAKIVIGQSMGAPIVLAPMNDGLDMAIAEGIESGLSIFQTRVVAVWVAGGAGRLLALAPLVPRYADCITIFADDDKAGCKGATDLADALLARGFTGDGQILLEGIS